MLNRTNKYMLYNFFLTFVSFFSTLFFILSMVFFIQISRITSIVEISFSELGKLYLFSLPKIFLFIIPISFFVSLTLMFFKLSKENEITVLFTLGYEPKKIAELFLVLGSLISSFLLLTSLFLIPLSEQLNLNFIEYKKTVAKLNVRPTEFGQKFSDWIIFVENEEKNSKNHFYKNIVMYYLKDGVQRFIVAQEAKVVNEASSLSLELKNGKAYDIQDQKIFQTGFEDMILRTKLDKKLEETKSTLNYWSDIFVDNKKSKDFITYTLISIFPFLSVLFAISIGIVTYRYQKGGVYSYIFLVLFAYFASVMFFAKFNPIIGITIISFLSLLISNLLFQKQILSRF